MLDRNRCLFLALATCVGLATGCHSNSDDHGGSGYITQAVAVADLDGNGGMDVLSANASYEDGHSLPGFLTARLQTQTPGTFQDPLRTTTGRYPLALAIGDLNGDGRKDIAVANYHSTGGTHSVALHFQATSAGVFGAAVELPVGARRPLDLAMADLLGQGRMDLVVAAAGGQDLLVFYHGTAQGAFLSPVSIPLGGEPAAVAVGDLTGTGTKDLVVALASGDVAVVLQGTAPGTYQTPVAYATGWDPVAVKLADLNGDGRLDILTANWSNDRGGLSVLVQNSVGSGTFQPAQDFDTGDYASSSVAVGDLNGDGLPDIVVANAGLPGYPGSVAVFLQGPRVVGAPLPGFTLQVPDLYHGYYGPYSVVIADLKGDGHPALVVADGSPAVRWPDPLRPGKFQPPVWLRQ